MPRGKGNQSNYHFKLINSANNEIHYFGGIDDIRNHLNISRRHAYSYLDKDYYGKSKNKDPNIKIERVNIAKVRFLYIKPETNEILH